LDEHGPASLSELAEAANVHVNTARPHVLALEQSGVLVERQRAARGPGRRVIEYRLVEPLALSESDFVGIAELLANALDRARLGVDELRRIGSDWGRYLSGRPGPRDPHDHVSRILARLGYRVKSGRGEITLERCLCPLIAPDSPMTVCSLMDGVVDGALTAAGGDVRVTDAEHHPELRCCRLQLDRDQRP
jgi:predicted ArsR family transcriptional regulator